MDRSDTPWPGDDDDADETTDALRTQHLFGLDVVADATFDDIVEVLLAPPPPNGPRLLVTPNVDHIVGYARDPAAARVARSAALVLPDGAPLVWASRLLGRPVRRRLTGSDLFPLLWQRLIAADRPVVVVGPNEDVRAGLSEQHPSAVILTAPNLSVAGPNGEPDEDGTDAALGRICDEIADAVRSTGSGHVVVAIGFPAHHRIAARLAARQLRDRPVWIMLLGAAPEFHLGLQQRAPQWVQRAGAEWLHRFMLEPRRMWRRYLLGGPRFARLVWRDRDRHSLRRD